jgi:hypothetical protein
MSNDSQGLNTQIHSVCFMYFTALGKGIWDFLSCDYLCLVNDG